MMTDVTVEELAEQAVTMLDVQPGQMIWLWASTHSLDLIEALAFRIRARGAFWMVRLIMEPLLRRIILNAPEEYLAISPEHEKRWLKDIHAIIEVHDHPGAMPEMPLARRRAIGTEWIELIATAARLGVRRIEVANPTEALATAYGIPADRFRAAYASATHIDYNRLDRDMERVAGCLRQGQEIRITSALGTDLRLNIGGRPILLDTDNIPRGEVYTPPLEDSANGVAVIDRAFIVGKPFERLTLQFHEGRVADVYCPDPRGVDAFRQLLAASNGDKDRIAEFAIGLNPGAIEPIGDIMHDEKIGGSVHIAIGMNDRFGGINRSNLHLDLVMLAPVVWVDDRLLVQDRVVMEK